MQRNWDLIKAILRKLEAAPASHTNLSPAEFPEWEADQVGEHIRLLAEQGLIGARCRQLGDGTGYAVAESLTWSGHELLATLKSETLWNSVQRLARKRGLELGYEIIKALAIELVTKPPHSC